MKYETFVKYKSNILFIQRLLLATIYIQILVSTYHLFIPSILKNTDFSNVGGIGVGLGVNVLGLIMASRIADLEGDRVVKFIRLIAIVGLIHQYFLGIDTIYTITIYTIALIGENIILPKLEIIQRTQNFVSRDKLTIEVHDAVAHADNYLKTQLTWVTNTLLLLIGVAVVTIIFLTLFNILPAILGFTRVIQIIAIIGLLSLFIVIVFRGFPQLDDLPSQYDLETN